MHHSAIVEPSRVVVETLCVYKQNTVLCGTWISSRTKQIVLMETVFPLDPKKKENFV
jgi:hypothetical protein